MKLKYVTITGVDARTDLARLEEIGEKYPFAEFGILMSYDWSMNGHRFPNPTQILPALKGSNLNLSAHFCGQMAKDVACGDISRIPNVDDAMSIFKRCQLNLRASGMFNTLRRVKPCFNIEEVIIQMHTPDTFKQFLKEKLPQCASYLLDASAGRGIDTPIEIVTHPGVHVGYAGGISPDNVASKLRTLLEHESDDVFWIDMETLVRTEDEWLDLDKVERVLSICQAMLTYYTPCKKG